MAKEPHLFAEENYPFENKHGTVSATVRRLYRLWNLWMGESVPPVVRRWEPGLESIRAIVRIAEAEAVGVRALGGAWSLSDAALTSGFLLDTSGLNHIKVGMQPQLITPGFPVEPRLLVFAQCGAQVLELNQVLDGHGLSLRTSGASNGQTIAGAFSTGTHGSAIGIGSMQECVHGIHLVVEKGDHYWIQRASRTPTLPDFAGILAAQSIVDDETFNAALVSFGSFGVIHAVLLEVEDRYLLEKHTEMVDFDDVKGAMTDLAPDSMRLPSGMGMPFHYELVINPHGTGKGDRGVGVRVIYKHDTAAPNITPGSPGVGPGDDLMANIGTLLGLIPGPLTGLLLKPILQKLLESDIQPGRVTVGTHGQTFGGNTLRGKARSCEIGVPVPRAANAVDLLLQAAGRTNYPGFIALRYVTASPATLAFTRHKPVTCTIELPGVAAPETTAFYAEVWKLLAASDIPHSFHWGQEFPQSPTTVAACYGDGADRWKAVRGRLLRTPQGRKMFSNALLAKCGLD